MWIKEEISSTASFLEVECKICKSQVKAEILSIGTAVAVGVPLLVSCTSKEQAFVCPLCQACHLR